MVEEIPEVAVELTGTESVNGINSGESIRVDTARDAVAIVGVKRVQLTDEDHETSVHISYKLLSRESKTKLEQLLHQWSEWHAQHCSSTKASTEDLESGDQTFFPALNVSSEKSFTVSLIIDDQVRKKQKMEAVLSCGSVPLYDREYSYALTSNDGSTCGNRNLEIMNASRCFNCDSYGHALKDCPKPRDNAAVNNARKQFHANKNVHAGPHVPTRYYQNSPRGMFDGLKPGCLAAETRTLLGIGELDPPPWLYRMRKLGYPPGYLDFEEEDKTSGITIYTDEKEDKENDELMFKLDNKEPQKKMSVYFPGINAPIPENGDQIRWAAPQSAPSFPNHQYNRSNYSPELTPRGHSYYYQNSPRPSSSNGPFLSSYANELNSFMSSFTCNSVENAQNPTHTADYRNRSNHSPFSVPPPPWRSL